MPRSRAYTGPFLAPTTQLFDTFCKDLVQRYNLQGTVKAAYVGQLDIVRAEEGCLLRLRYQEPDCTTLKTAYARRVVLALGPGRPRWPTWARTKDGSRPLAGCFHVEDLFSQRTPSAEVWKNKAITVVGGGITAVQWAMLAAEKGMSLHC